MYNRAKVVFFSGIEKRLSHKVADKYQKNISSTHTTPQITPPNAYTCHTKTLPAPHHIGRNQQQKTAQIQGKTTAQNHPLFAPENTQFLRFVYSSVIAPFWILQPQTIQQNHRVCFSQ